MGVNLENIWYEYQDGENYYLVKPVIVKENGTEIGIYTLELVKQFFHSEVIEGDVSTVEFCAHDGFTLFMHTYLDLCKSAKTWTNAKVASRLRKSKRKGGIPYETAKQPFRFILQKLFN